MMHGYVKSNVRHLPQAYKYKCLDMRWRDLLVKYFAWSMPTMKVGRLINSFLGEYGAKGIVELGAGSGCWARFLNSKFDIEVDAFDWATKNNGWINNPAHWYDVGRAGNSVLDRSKYKSCWVLLLCWPPYDSDFAHNSLRKFKGDSLIYVSEGYGGCTANDKFHNELEKKWELWDKVEMPNIGLSVGDYCKCYRRL